MILDYVGDPSRDDSEGWWLLALLASMLLLRLAFFTLNFNVGLQTAIRLGGATQYLGFSKLLRQSIYIYWDSKLLEPILSFSTCQRNLIKKTFQIEGMIALIKKMDLIFSWLVKWPKIAVKKCQNLIFKVNFQRQKSPESF